MAGGLYSENNKFYIGNGTQINSGWEGEETSDTVCLTSTSHTTNPPSLVYSMVPLQNFYNELFLNYIQQSSFWYCNYSPLPKTKKPMFSTLMKRLLDSDTKTLIKAGFLDSELDLTEEGETELMSLLLLANKEAMVKAALEKIQEEKEKCGE